MEEINRQNPISDNQWGFTQGKSTVGALLTAVDNWHQSLEAKMDVCAVFFDLKKAFDSVRLCSCYANGTGSHKVAYNFIFAYEVQDA